MSRATFIFRDHIIAKLQDILDDKRLHVNEREYWLELLREVIALVPGDDQTLVTFLFDTIYRISSTVIWTDERQRCLSSQFRYCRLVRLQLCYIYYQLWSTHV